MRLCKVTDIKFTGEKDFKTVQEWQKDMRDNAEDYEKNVDFTFHEDKPILRIETETTHKVVEVK